MGARRRSASKGRVSDEAADEREPVRVKAARGEAEHHVARAAGRAVDDLVPLHDPDHRPGEVELALPVDAGQLGRLAAEDGAPGFAADRRGAGDELGDLGEVERRSGNVVEEEERLGAGRQKVVRAVRGQVAPGVGEPARALREDELRADAVRRRGQKPLVVEREEAGEPAEPARHGFRPGRLDRRPQPLDHLLGLRQRDTGLAVRGCLNPFHNEALSLRAALCGAMRRPRLRP